VATVASILVIVLAVAVVAVVLLLVAAFILLSVLVEIALLLVVSHRLSPDGKGSTRGGSRVSGSAAIVANTKESLFCC
jgi:membrane protein implicated in regulation of membrane protease activity